MPATFQDTDLGYDALLATLGDMGDAAVYVGILQDQGSELDEDGNITVAGYAAVNEFGSADGSVPERSFLRSTVDANGRVYESELQAVAIETVDAAVRSLSSGQAEATLERGLGRVGARAARDVQVTIRDLRDPPNAPSTLAGKYPGDNPLIETGRMRQSISFAVSMDGGEP